MDRRKFIAGSALAVAWWIAPGGRIIFSSGPAKIQKSDAVENLYSLFRHPKMHHRPFVRWWWNGNKVEEGELIRELQLLKAAGIGGVEINPIQFPSRYEGDDLGRTSLQWLGEEWIRMLQVVFREAQSLGMICDLIVGSGWPFGSETLTEDERSQIVVIGVRKFTGPLNCSLSREEIFIDTDPAVSSPWEGRKPELLSLLLVPDPVTSADQLKDLSDLAGGDRFDIFIPEGDHALYAMVRVNGFMKVINGAPGASGPVLDHFNKDAVRKYLQKMSDIIVSKAGPLSGHLRALFTDSMELEGANWTADMRSEFIRRRGYDIFPYLPLVLFRTGAMGNVTDFSYGASTGDAFSDMIERMRYDFETTKAEMLEERFLRTFASWCRENGVKSRMQAYGRGFHPLESSLAVDIPEGESWTMNWLKHRIGEEMPESDYRRGRAYTMVNKYVSSAAHLGGKSVVSCEEMTDTYTVFNTSLENLKVGSDQSIISGINHSVFHGFNYSPPEAPYPGWIRYGGYFSENNNWWPHFHLLNEYKARLSAVLQNSEMYAEIAILPPIADMWSRIGAQNEPFPSVLHAEYLSLVWEAIVKNGSACDYVSEKIIRDAVIEDRYLRYGTRKYHTLFLVQVESLEPSTAMRLLEFINSGGRVFCIETIPRRSAGWKNHEQNDRELADLVERMRAFPERFILLKKPQNDFFGWYRDVQRQYLIKPYLTIHDPGPFLMQTRHRGRDGTEMFFIVNSHLHNSCSTKVTFSDEVIQKKHAWVWDPESGCRHRLKLNDDRTIDLDLGPAQSLLLVFGHERTGSSWKPLPSSGRGLTEIASGWMAEFRHCLEGSLKEVMIDRLTDLKEMDDFVHFSGTVTYRNSLICKEPAGLILNLGKVWGTSELRINGKSCGVKWYGRRIFKAEEYLHRGKNLIEIIVTTSMGNFMKSLTDNPIAQYWTNVGNKNQPLQSMGLIGPVTYYYQ